MTRRSNTVVPSSVFTFRPFARALILMFVLGGSVSALGQTFPFHIDPNARENSSEIVEIPAIRFLTTDDFPPFNYRAPGGELVGYHVDLANAICEVLEAACTIQVWPWLQIRDALLDNQGDALIAGLAIDSVNAERFDFSQIYLMFPGRFVSSRDNLALFNADNLQDRVIAVRRGTGHELFASKFLTGAKIAKFTTELEALQAVESGAAYAYFGDALRASFWLNQSQSCCAFTKESYFRSDLFGQGLAITFPAEMNQVRHAINQALVQLQRDGTLDRLYLRWFPVGFY